MKTFLCDDGKTTMTRVSRWITLQHGYNLRKNNQLWYYVEDQNGNKSYQPDFDPARGTYCDYFTFRGVKYALSRFYALGSFMVGGTPYTFQDTDGKTTVIGAVDMDGDMYWPLYLQFDEYGERVRVYENAHKGQLYFKGMWYNAG